MAAKARTKGTPPKEIRARNEGLFACVDCQQSWCRFCEWSGSPRLCKECRSGLCCQCFEAAHELREGYCAFCFSTEKRVRVAPVEAWRPEWKPRKDRTAFKQMLTAEMARRAKKKESDATGPVE